MYSRAVIACAIGALLSGCASNGQPPAANSGGTYSGVAPAGIERGNPALIFATPEMRQLLAQRGLAPGFGFDDWEYGRNDQAVSVGASGARSGGFSAFEITQFDHLYDTNGQPRSSSRTTVRSVRSGRSR